MTARAVAFKSSLPESIRSSLASLIRAMNFYYSNLIEGHDTHPVDIERALKNEYSLDAKKRDLQYEAKAHIKVSLQSAALPPELAATITADAAGTC